MTKQAKKICFPDFHRCNLDKALSCIYTEILKLIDNIILIININIEITAQVFLQANRYTSKSRAQKQHSVAKPHHLSWG